MFNIDKPLKLYCKMLKKLQSKTFKGYLMIAFLLTSAVTWSQTTVTRTFGSFGFSNGQKFPSGQIDDNISFTTEKNNSGTDPAYYNSGGIRLYGGAGDGGSITLTPAAGFVITSVVFTATQPTNADYTVDNGTSVSVTASSGSYTINGINAATSLRFRNAASSTSGHVRVNGVTVTYSQSGVTGAPTITATGVSNGTDSYIGGASIAIASVTEGAVIHYTTDGTDPTTASATYSAPFNITGTTTIKALATATDLETSGITEKTFTITQPATAVLPYSEAFNNTLADWTNVSVSGNRPWVADSKGAYGNGYPDPSLESWLVSPKFTGVTGNFAASFDYEVPYTGQPLEVLYSTNYDGYSAPSTATWSTLTSISATSTGSSSTGNILVPVNSNVHIAFKYITASSAPHSAFYISNFVANVAPPTVTTTQIVADVNTITTATSGGTITQANGTVSQKGIVWDTNANPTTSLTTKTEQGEGTGTNPETFVSNITGLLPNTLYYYRAYAINQHGTAYGTEYSFTTRAYAPGAPVVTEPNSTTLTVAIAENGNNAATKYSIRVNGGIYTNAFVQDNGSVGTAEVFLTAEEWGSTIIQGLATTTTYTFDSRARNNAAALTNWSATATGTTTASTVPALILSEAALEFGNICLNEYATGSFSFTGQTLSQPTTLVVSAIDGYSFSATETGNYTSTLTIENYNGSEITVWVRLTPATEQSYDTDIQVDGQGDNATAVLDLAATGTGINTPGTALTNALPAEDIAEDAAILSGTANKSCSDITEYGFEYSTTPGFTSGTVIISTDVSSGNFIAMIDNLTPATTYYYKSYITDASGTQYGAERSFVTASLTAPVTTAGTEIGQTSFTANWTPVTGATEYRLDVSPYESFGSGELATDLFFSEYVEGSGNNKFIEIYNGTKQPIDLSDYRLRLYSNGNTVAGSSVQLSGILQPFSTIVYKNSSSPDVASAIDNAAVNYNGDDALDLYKISTNSIVDIFGTIGQRPSGSWSTGSGANQIKTADMSLRRKPTVTGGITVNPGNGFPALATEWDAYPVDTFDGLGSHDFNYKPAYVSGYENLPVNGTSAVVTGLTDNTTYYYKVRAYSSTQTSADSNITSVTTLIGNVTWTIPANGTVAAWVPNVTPDETINAIISADYNTATNGSFVSKNLTLSQNATFTVASGTTATVYGTVNNLAAPANFVVENNASLLQNSDAANTGDITVIRNSNSLYRHDYTMWSSPVSGTQTMQAFSPKTATDRFYEYRYGTNSSNKEVEAYFLVQPTATFETAHAYLIRMPNLLPDVPGYDAIAAPATFEGTFIGTANNGTINRSLSTEGNRYTSVGNPYPSPISVYDFFMDDNNRNALADLTGLYLWRKKNNSATSSYAVLSLAGLIVNSGNEAGGQDMVDFFPDGNEDDNKQWTLAPGQGFIVRTKENAVNPQVNFTNSMRRPASVNGNPFFKTAQPAGNGSRYWINITDAKANNSQTLVAYRAGASKEIDFGYDARRFNDNSLSVYTTAANQQLSIQARPEFDATDVVNLGYNAPAAGTFTISLNRKDGVFNNGQEIFLTDNAEGIIYNLKNGAYSFTTEAGNFNSRFELRYVNIPLNTDVPVLDAGSIAVYKTGNTININSGATLMQNVTIFDIRGRQLTSVANINNTETAITNLVAEQQVLIVQIATDKGTVSKKIVF